MMMMFVHYIMMWTFLITSGCQTLFNMLWHCYLVLFYSSRSSVNFSSSHYIMDFSSSHVTSNFFIALWCWFLLIKCDINFYFLHCNVDFCSPHCNTDFCLLHCDVHIRLSLCDINFCSPHMIKFFRHIVMSISINITAILIFIHHIVKLILVHHLQCQFLFVTLWHQVFPSHHNVAFCSLHCNVNSCLSYCNVNFCLSHCNINICCVMRHSTSQYGGDVVVSINECKQLKINSIW